jgi:histidinol-phosphate aminotransferase
MKQLSGAFDDMGLEHIPSVGNFIAVRMPRPGAEIFDELLRKGVIVRPISEYGMPDFIRVTVGLKKENERFIEALREIIGG